MKRSALLVSLLVIALVAFASVASAQQASVFGDGVLVRAFITETGGICSNGPATSCTSDSDCGGETCDPRYSAYLEVRDETGSKLPITDFTVTADLGTMPPEVTANPFQIHNNDLVNNDITLSYDSLTNRIYVFCTNATLGLHVMAYKISLNRPVSGVCGSANTQAYYTAPDSNLCGVGNASEVSGSGSTWTWMCYGNGIGTATNANCSAYKKVYGQCGSSNNQTLSSAPTLNLCGVGSTASSVTGNGPWNWTCTGAYGGSTVNCSANTSQTGNRIDLAITTASSPTAVNPGALLPITATIKNNSSNAAGAFTVNYYLGSATGTLLSTATVSGLAGGATTTASVSPRVYLTAHVWTYITIVVVPNALDTDTVPSNNSYVRYVQGN